MPDSENISMAIKKAIQPLVRARPDRSEIVSTALPWTRMARMTAKTPSVVTR